MQGLLQSMPVLDWLFVSSLETVLLYSGYAIAMPNQASAASSPNNDIMIDFHDRLLDGIDT